MDALDFMDRRDVTSYVSTAWIAALEWFADYDFAVPDEKLG